MDPPPKPALYSYLSDAEWRRRAAAVLYELESAFRERADRALLRKRGRLHE